ncbi:hypothetical protein C8F01DRAFT_1251598 [Mycena amicta]|nr:hypothetical protein C8F01DRAFT_1251598 [Mycena amicta]
MGTHVFMRCRDAETVLARHALRDALEQDFGKSLPRPSSLDDATRVFQQLIFDWDTVVPTARFVYKVVRNWRWFGQRLPTMVSELTPETDEEGWDAWDFETATEDALTCRRTVDGSFEGQIAVVGQFEKKKTYFIVLLAFIQMTAGTVHWQTAWTYIIRSFAELERTKAATTLQTAASLACDMSITAYLCIFLRRHRNGMPRTQELLKAVMINAVNRGMLTSLTSAGTIILFVAFPNTFWFFLTLAPNSKLYMNSMLATLNMRDHFRRKIFGPTGQEIETVNLHDVVGARFSPSGRRISVTISAVEFVHPPPRSATELDLSIPSTTSNKGDSMSFPSSETV